MKTYLQKPIVRALAILIVTIIAAYVQYRLARVPLPVEVSDTKKVGVPPIRLGDQLILNGLELSPQKRLLFSYLGDAKEAIDVRFDQASIPSETRSLYRLNQKFDSAGPISYTTYRPGASPRICTTSVEALSVDNNAPAKIVIAQSEGPGNQIYRNLAVRVDREVLINVATNPPPDPPDDADENGPGCTKLLAGSSKHLLEGGTLLKTKLTPDTNVDFRFLPLNPSAPVWSGHDGAFEPLRFTSPVFQAKSVTIANAKGAELFHAISSSDQPLRVNKLKIGSDTFQAEFSGIGFVKINGDPITLSLFERIKEYPIFAAMFLAINGAIAAWLLSQIRGLFQKQPSAETPRKASAKPKRRKR